MKTKRFLGIMFLVIMVFASACGSKEEGDKPSDPVTQPAGSIGNLENPATAGQQTAITIDQAKEIALKDAGVDAAGITNIRAKLSKADGREEYEVKFRTQEKEYEYEISAADGSILLIEETSLGTDPEPSTDITEAEAKEIALKDAGVTEEEVRNFQIHLDTDELIPEYEIEFEFGNKEYEYEISVSDGTIRSRKIDLIDGPLPSSTPIPEQPQNTPTPVPTQPQDTPTPAPTKTPQAPTPTNQMITEKEAKQIALQDAGVTEADISNLRIKLDYDDGHAEYEIEFKSGNKEYDYDIAAADGAILSRKIEEDDDFIPSATPGQARSITAEEAKQIAFASAGVTETEVWGLEIETDHEHGRIEYEIEFMVGYTEYKYEISEDGTILDWEIETDEDYGHHSHHHSSNTGYIVTGHHHNNEYRHI